MRVRKSTIESEALKELVRENHITHKLIISECRSIAKEHMIIRYNFEAEVFEVLALAPILINGAVVDKTQGFITIKALDQIEFPCDRRYMPMVFYLVMPTPDQQAPMTSQQREALLAAHRT